MPRLACAGKATVKRAMFLVTGGAGFIGSNLVAALARSGMRVVVCDRLGVGEKWRNLAKHEIERCLLPEQLEEFLKSQGHGLSAIFHLGAISSTTERDADALLVNNLQLSQRLWQVAAERGTPFLYASSAATYGGGECGYDDDASPDYLARLRPLNAYGWSKLAFDRWVVRRLAEGAPRPPQWAGLKFFNVYGPNEYHKEGQASVAYHLFRQVSAGEPARLFRSHRADTADGDQKRDFIHVEDCVAVMLWLAEHPEVNGLFNVGTGQARSFADLARAVFDTLDQPQNISYVPTPEAIRDSYQYFTEARMERLRAAGYDRAFLSLEEGVARYLRDYLLTDDPYH